ncbi:hypothetical protein Bca52824_053976 [Brassica carinata]|uniref:Uncharacterized protein n=1 Tax=Brassica carinata TaxID=52824 RepID=A0A8X7UNQ3_BRACI|nr:hypothetical protein Bca52824_053976 [Brassica carinata]
MLMVMRNINESSDGLSVNVIKENHVDVQPAIYDVLFMRRLASPLGVVLVYVFSGEEGSLILWPLLVHTMSMRIFGFSYNIIVVVVTEELICWNIWSFGVGVQDLHSTRRTRFLHGTSYVNWLEQDECTCDQAPVTLYWKIKGTYKIGGGSEERDKNVSQMVLFKVWEQ